MCNAFLTNQLLYHAKLINHLWNKITSSPDTCHAVYATYIIIFSNQNMLLLIHMSRCKMEGVGVILISKSIFFSFNKDWENYSLFSVL